MTSRVESAIDIDNTLFFDGISLGSADSWRVKAELEIRSGNIESGLAAAEKQLEAAKNSGNTKGEAEAALSVARASIWAGKVQQALENVEQAQRLYNTIGDDKDNGFVKLVTARVHILGKLWDDAYEAAMDALALFKKAGNSKLNEAAALNTIAICELMRGNADDCMKRVEASADMFQDIGEKRGQASALHTKSILLAACEAPAEGFQIAQEASALLKDAGDDRRYVASLLAVSESALTCGDYLEAISSTEDALEVLVKLGDKRGQVVVLLGLCTYYFKQEMFVKGIDTANNVISNCKDIGDKQHEAQAWFMTAQLKRAKVSQGGMQWPPKRGISENDLDELQKAAQNAVDLFEEIGHGEGEAGSRFELCHAFLVRDELDRAQKEIQLSQKKFREAGDTNGECISTIIGAQVQAAIGEKELAATTMERALDLAQDGAVGQGKFLERVCKDWIEKQRPKVKEASKEKSQSPDQPGDSGGITAAAYAQCIHRSILSPDLTGENFYENPQQCSGLETILDIKFTFYRNRPPAGQEFDLMACKQAWDQPYTPAVIKPVALKTSAAGGEVAQSDLKLKKPRLPPMALPPEKSKPASSRATGSDILGGRLPEVPEAVHADMVALAAKGEIPVTKPEDRAIFITKRPTFYGDPIFRDALRFGYIHPTANQVPRGKKWKSVRAGAFKLVTVA